MVANTSTIFRSSMTVQGSSQPTFPHLSHSWIVFPLIVLHTRGSATSLPIAASIFERSGLRLSFTSLFQEWAHLSFLETYHRHDVCQPFDWRASAEAVQEPEVRAEITLWFFRNQCINKVGQSWTPKADKKYALCHMRHLEDTLTRLCLADHLISQYLAGKAHSNIWTPHRSRSANHSVRRLHNKIRLTHRRRIADDCNRCTAQRRHLDVLHDNPFGKWTVKKRCRFGLTFFGVLTCGLVQVKNHNFFSSRSWYIIPNERGLMIQTCPIATSIKPWTHQQGSLTQVPSW